MDVRQFYDDVEEAIEKVLVPKYSQNENGEDVLGGAPRLMRDLILAMGFSVRAAAAFYGQVRCDERMELDDV